VVLLQSWGRPTRVVEKRGRRCPQIESTGNNDPADATTDSRDAGRLAGGAGASTPKQPASDGRTGGTANQPVMTDAPSEYGHHVIKDSDGAYDIDPHGAEDTEVTHFADGSAQIKEPDGNITRYVPAPADGGEGATNYIESIHYDAATDQTTQVMIQNGQRTEVTSPGRPDTAAPVGSPEALGALGTIPSNPPSVYKDPDVTPADPPVAGQAVPDVGVINPADPPLVVNHPGQNSADVYPGDGQQPVQVNPQTGEQIGLGTTDNPQQGPFVPRTFDWVPDTINNTSATADTASMDPGAAVAGPGAGDVALGAASGAASAADRANNADGRNGKPVGAHRQDTAAERASRGIGGKVPARALGFAGNTVTGAQAISDAIDDPDHAGGAIGGGLVGNIGGGAGGAYVGGAIGALGGPLAPVTVPLGGAIGGVIGGELGKRALEPVGQAIQNLFK
jgi:hypothetical protein